jgi:DNA-binding NarL/FixJ family response regulator
VGQPSTSLSHRDASRLRVLLIMAPQPSPSHHGAQVSHAAWMTALTAREREVLALLQHRLTDAEIGTALCISRRTVSNHVSNILAKLGAANRREAWVLAVRLGLG